MRSLISFVHQAAGNRPEDDLLLCSARVCLDSSNAERLRELLRHNLDWAYLLRLAHRHGITPLLSRHLSEVCPDGVPPAILEELRNHAHYLAVRNLHLTGELLQMMKWFESHGISAIPYKGPALAADLYGNLALRPFQDLDILVRSQDLLKIKELLVSGNYQPIFPLSQDLEIANLRSAGDRGFFHEDKDVLVEIHWRIVARAYAFVLDFDQLARRSRPTSLGGVTVPTLAPEDLLLCLCVLHTVKHLWKRLCWISDIAELIRVHPDLDWDRVMEQARKLGCKRMLFLGLALASDLLNAVIPKEIAHHVKADAMVKTLVAQVCQNLFRDDLGSPGVVERTLFHLRARERLRDRVECCLRLMTALNENDWAFVSLPAYLYFLYYPCRLIRLARKYKVGSLEENTLGQGTDPAHSP